MSHEPIGVGHWGVTLQHATVPGRRPPKRDWVVTVLVWLVVAVAAAVLAFVGYLWAEHKAAYRADKVVVRHTSYAIRTRWHTHTVYVTQAPQVVYHTRVRHVPGPVRTVYVVRHRPAPPCPAPSPVPTPLPPSPPSPPPATP